MTKQSPTLFHSGKEFKKQFVKGLIDIYTNEDNLKPETFVLLICNSFFEKEISGLLSRYAENYYKKLYKLHKEGKLENTKSDDYEVMKKIFKFGFKKIKPIMFRKEEKLWDIQYNPLREMRPERAAVQKVNKIKQKFEDKGFNYTRSYIENEILYEGVHKGNKFTILFNKFPFARYHTLLVPERLKKHPQFLTKKFLEMAYSFMKEMSPKIDGLGMGYNSYGGYASVNHLHFQMFIDEKGMPYNDKRWLHNEGNEKYPARVEVFDEIKKCMKFITQLHNLNIPYNLLFSENKIYCFPRVFQQSRYERISGGFAWFQFAGCIICLKKETYKKVTGKLIRQQLKVLSKTVKPA
ncbi:hypothetical protein BH10BAC5_BH10BAC5_28190 [soil metagenome]